MKNPNLKPVKDGEENYTYSIPLCISAQNLADFTELVRIYKKQIAGKKILIENYGVAVVPMHDQAGNIAVMAAPTLYIEHECTQDEFNSWKFSQNLQKQ